AADFFVVAPVGIFGPGVEAELDGEQPPPHRPAQPAGCGCAPMACGVVGLVLWAAFAVAGACAIQQADAAGVAQPDAVGGPEMEAHIAGECAGTVEELSNLPFGGGV